MILLRPKVRRNSKPAEFARLTGLLSVVLLLTFAVASLGRAQTAKDPGVRGGPAGAGGFIQGLNSYQQGIETSMSSFIAEVNVVAGGSSVKRVGLGARFDSNSCTGCHAGPKNGGASLPNNPLFNVYQLMGAQNTMPFFETSTGPTLVARAPYKSDMVTPDGHVKQLFVITGRTDAGTCNLQQPDFNTLAAEGNLIFRQTTPFYGGGMLELIQDSDIVNNMMSNLSQKMALGITGHPNYNADDGSISRFGWKAQKRSLMLFAGEAYNIEEGISNEIFPNKTDETPGCTPPFPLGPPNGNGPHGVPDDRSDFAAVTNQAGYLYPGDPERFAIFGRLLDQPKPGACPGGNNSSCVNGQTQFNNIGCGLCHTQSFTLPKSSISALSGVHANVYSDVLVHHMGYCDADNVTQGQAGGDEFRTSPLWGVGQRYFFMHDGRTMDIVQAIEDHSELTDPNCTGVNAHNYLPSEADAVVQAFNGLASTDQQDLINFLRSL